MSLKILAPITKLTTGTLNVTTTPASGGTPCRLSASALLTSIPFSTGILAAADTSTLPTYLAFANTSACVLVNKTSHTSTTGTTYDVAISNADLYPLIMFEFDMRKMTSAGAAFPIMTFNGDATSAYVRRMVANYSSGSTLSVVNDTYTSMPLAEVNGYLTTDNTHTGYSHGIAYLKSGNMRSVMMESGQALSGQYGIVHNYHKWTNTANVVTAINITIPNNVYCYFKIYQQMG